jgi:hypothetical protein
MSLINDALKRVKAAQQHDPPPASIGPQLKPVEGPLPRPTRGIWLPAFLALAALLALNFIWQLRKHGDTAEATVVKAHTPENQRPLDLGAVPPVATPVSDRTLAATRSNEVQAPRTQALAPASPAGNRSMTTAEHAPGPGQSPSAAVPPRSSSTSATGSAASVSNPTVLAASDVSVGTNQSSVTTSNLSAPPDLAPPKPPPLKLQGIVFNPQRPSALVNGRTVFIGDRVREMRVVAISMATLTLSGAGQTNVLSLADN